MNLTGRKIRIWKAEGRWVWECTLCQPPVMGSTARFAKTCANASRHSTRNRRQHHEWVARRYGRDLPA